MNINSVITLEQVQAALNLKVQSLEKSLKEQYDGLRTKLYGFNSEMRSRVTNNPDCQKMIQNISTSLKKLFCCRKDDISVEVSYGSNYYDSGVPGEFLTYPDYSLDTKSKSFRVHVDGYVRVKGNDFNRQSGGFGFNQYVIINNTLEFKKFLSNWNDTRKEFQSLNVIFQQIATFKKNFNSESQLVLLELQNPEAHKNLIEYTDSYLKGKFKLTV